MNKKTLKELDYYTIRDEIAGFCVSEEGEQLIKTWEPLTDSTRIEELKALGREWSTYLHTTRPQALSSWPGIRQVISLLRVTGATLSQEQVFALYQFCMSVKKACDAVTSAEKDLKLTALPQLVQKLPSLEQPAACISRVIDADGMLKDLPELRAIRAAIAACRREIAACIRRYTSDQSLSSVLESTVPVHRADRQLLAVKAGSRNAISGIIHEVSNSGQTVYIEPDDVIRKNNELVQEEFHLQQEIRRILKELTAQLQQSVPELNAALPVMLELDTTCAAAKWGLGRSCVYALPCAHGSEPDGEPPLILQARHPLLGDKAVPVDVPFMQGKRVLIITGPNTGGKTVTLKTIALFAMLNQTGFPVPAAEGTRLPVFTNCFADIGDEQSLDQSLSTFSGHMKNIATAVNRADGMSMVLLDELGSGTDPQEGSAIAMAVLDALIQKGAFVLVTTHHGILKNYGYTNPACVNASVDFNSDTLAPTYRLVMGVPGESHALDIAARSGLPRKITARARSYITNEQADVSSLIKGLTAKHTELDKKLIEYDRMQRELAALQHKNEHKSLQLRRQELELQKHGQRNAERFLKESRKELENLVRTLKEGEVTHEKAVSVKQYIAALTDTVAQHETHIEQEEAGIAQAQQEQERQDAQKPAQHKSKKKTAKRRLSNAEALAAAVAPVQEYEAEHAEPLTFKPGAEVLAGSARSRGVLIAPAGRGTWSVQFGSIKMNIKERDMTLIPSARFAAPPSYSVDYAPDDGGSNSLAENMFPGNKPLFELRLLGMRQDEAIKTLQAQLDLCTIHNFKEFSIIHGKGTGVLQQAVQDYLSHYPGVAEFRFAPPEDGGSGKTYVKML